MSIYAIILIGLTVSTYSNAAQVELTRESAELERRLEPITAELNQFPLRVNKTKWQENYDAADYLAGCLTQYCQYLALNDDFRPNSPADCRRALGVVATDKDTLTGLVNSGSPLAEAILDARSAIACQSQLRKWGIFAGVGFVQPLWDSMGTPHGRYTCEGPCLTNRIRPIRQTITADPGFTFLSLDKSQAEYVVWASLSGDLVLSELFLAGRDFHQEMAETVLALVPDWDLRGQEPRQAGKTLNFCLLYLMMPYTLGIQLGCSQAVARKIIKSYYKRARTGVRYIHKVLEDAHNRGFVETYFGRRRYCPEYHDAGTRAVHEVEKTLWSHHNAGSAAEVVKMKQCDIWEMLRRERFTAEHVRLSLNMFDQLIWSVRDDLLNDVKPIVEEIWNRRVPGFLPFRSQIKTGKDWGSL
jgi:DNA polymerase I-like protein with 3'-5' exonuclease and polymerase domains